MNFLLVFVGGGLGCVLRYSISLIIPEQTSNFPLATFISNVLACAILAILVKLSLDSKIDHKYMLLGATGFCGGFSTFSTFSLENIKLLQSGFTGIALLNAVISVIVCGLVMHFILNK